MKNRLREVREEKKISQERLSEIAGISRTVISKIECNETVNLNVSTIVKISKALEVEPETIFLF